MQFDVNKDPHEFNSIDDFIDGYPPLREILDILKELQFVILELKANEIEIDDLVIGRIKIYLLGNLVSYSRRNKSFKIDANFKSPEFFAFLDCFIKGLLDGTKRIEGIFLRALVDSNISNLLLVINEFIKFFQNYFSKGGDGVCFNSVLEDGYFNPDVFEVHIDRKPNSTPFSVLDSYRKAVRIVDNYGHSKFVLRSWLLNEHSYQYFRRKFPNRKVTYISFDFKTLKKLVSKGTKYDEEDFKIDPSLRYVDPSELIQLMISPIWLSPNVLYDYLAYNILPDIGIVIIDPEEVES